MKRILVTGGLGYIGKEMNRALLEAGYEALWIDKKEGFEKDLTNPLISIPDCDAVIHLAADISNPESIQEPLQYYYNNIKSTINLLCAMKSKGIKKIVFASSAAVYGKPPAEINYIDEKTVLNPSTPYAKSKVMCEEIIKDVCIKNEIDFFILRLFNVAGNNNPHQLALIPRIIHCLENNVEFCVFGDGDQIRDFVHVEDVCRAAIMCLESEKTNKILNIGVGRGLKVSEVMKICEAIVGKELNFRKYDARLGDVEKCICNEGKAREVIDFMAQRSIQNIIASEWKAKYSSK